jgi:hypothetical protein
VVEITPVSINSIGWRTYVYFAVPNAFFIPLIYFFYPETRGLSLENIDRLFTSGKVTMHWKESWGEPGDLARFGAADAGKESVAAPAQSKRPTFLTLGS